MWLLIDHRHSPLGGNACRKRIRMRRDKLLHECPRLYAGGIEQAQRKVHTRLGPAPFDTLQIADMIGHFQRSLPKRYPPGLPNLTKKNSEYAF